MRFETSQQMKMGQQMKLAPRMIQSMEILQMPLAELEERLEQELESNPTLEMVEGDPGALDSSDGGAGSDASGDFGEGSAHERDGADEFGRLDDFESANPEAAANSFDDDDAGGRGASVEHVGTRSAGGMEALGEARDSLMANAPARAGSLADQLLAQWALVDVEPRVRTLGEQIIQFLDEDGYLRTPIEEVADRAPGAVRELNPGEADWELALGAVQVLIEPAGVAARDARECLLLQIDAIEEQQLATGEGAQTEAGMSAARLLVEDHLDDLMNNRLPKIASKSGLTLDEINAGVESLRRLSLAPARRLVSETPAAIRPDAVVEFDEEGDRYIAYLTDTRASQMRINREYALMAKDKGVPERDRAFLRTNLSNAQWLLDAVGQRRQTMLRVIEAVLDEQRDAFDFGPEAIKPLPMKTVADRLGVHVATVSRAVADKWLETPRGMMPLRGFFTGGLATDSGEDASANEIKGAIESIVESENKSKPLSDDAISKALKDKGYEVARRTVAKYRGQLEIPSARLRKQFG